jgi:hypothetical protein
MSEPSTRPTSSAISAYARNARRAVRLQVIVAGLAFVATVVFALLIANQTAQLNKVNAEKAAALERLRATDTATQAVLKAAAAFASGDKDRYDAAIDRLRSERTNFASIATDVEAQDDQTAFSEVQKVRHSINRALASALFSRPGRSLDDLSGAIQFESDNLTLPGLDERDRYASTIALAAYQCAADDTAAAKALLNDAFLAQNPEATREITLLDACGGLFEIPEAEIAAFNPQQTDPQFRVRRIFLHIVTEADRGRAQALGRALCEAGYAVPRIELVSKSAAPKLNQVRYYYPAQASEAEWIASRFNAQPDRDWTWEPPAIRQLTGFDNLDPQNIEIWLRESPAVSGRMPNPAVEATLTCRTASQTPAALDIPAVIAQLTSDNKAQRLAAGQTVANLIRSDNDSAIIAALIAELQPPRLEQLTASGRLNVLYMLNIEPAWQSRAEAQPLREALATVRARASQGVAIGGQTNDCLTKLESKLRGNPAADTCGGL